MRIDYLSRIEGVRQRLGTWKATAEALGVSPRTLRRWRSEERVPKSVRRAVSNEYRKPLRRKGSERGTSTGLRYRDVTIYPRNLAELREQMVSLASRKGQRAEALYARLVWQVEPRQAVAFLGDRYGSKRSMEIVRSADGVLDSWVRTTDRGTFLLDPDSAIEAAAKPGRLVAARVSFLVGAE